MDAKKDCEEDPWRQAISSTVPFGNKIALIYGEWKEAWMEKIFLKSVAFRVLEIALKHCTIMLQITVLFEELVIIG